MKRPRGETSPAIPINIQQSPISTITTFLPSIDDKIINDMEQVIKDTLKKSDVTGNEYKTNLPEIIHGNTPDAKKSERLDLQNIDLAKEKDREKVIEEIWNFYYNAFITFEDEKTLSGNQNIDTLNLVSFENLDPSYIITGLLIAIGMIQTDIKLPKLRLYFDNKEASEKAAKIIEKLRLTGGGYLNDPSYIKYMKYKTKYLVKSGKNKVMIRKMLMRNV